jgi:hypothetical protein
MAKNEKEEKKGMSLLDKIVIGTSAVGGGAATGSGIVTAIGFTPNGIAAASWAAGLQAGIGNVVGTSLFATAQSLGASGLVVTVGLTGGGILLVGAGYGGYRLYQHIKQPKQPHPKI